MFIALGVSNRTVRIFKSKLRKLGFTLSDTDTYDPETDTATQNICKEYKIPYTGSLTPEIQDLVDSLLIKPTHTGVNKEDFSDPEETIQVDNHQEEEKVCDNIQALIKYVENFNITRRVHTLFLHCTATPQTATISAIENYWRNTLGWRNPGYHIIVNPKGEWSVLLDFNKISNGVSGHNSTSINIAYIGGIDSKGNPLNNLTTQQEMVFRTIIRELGKKINIKTRGHNEVSKKACPSFDVQEFLKN